MEPNNNNNINNIITPVKSVSDDKEYRIIKLSNGLIATLVSDSSTDKSAASMCVGVGTLYDPIDVQGLAHLLEHMLFLGTKKYPDPKTFHSFLSAHGGKSNAYTLTESTTYIFDIQSSFFKDSLEIWSQFFIGPLFTQEKTDLELRSIDGEHKKNLNTDVWRVGQLYRSRSDPHGPYSKFGTGTYNSLSEVPHLRERLLSFYEQYYSANIMKLVVLGRESLDVLEEWVKDIFSPIASHIVKFPEISKPFQPEQLKKILYSVPLKDSGSVSLFWQVPSYFETYRSSPEGYISSLLGHEGKGSYLSLLKSKGWACELVCGPSQPAASFAFFQLNIELTTEGHSHINEIVDLAFQYIHKLRFQNGVQEWIHLEIAKLLEIKFRFKGKAEPFDYVSAIVSNMYRYPLEHALAAQFIRDIFDPKGILDFLDQLLKVENFRIHVVGQIYKDICEEKEKWYGTSYKEEDISPEFLLKLKLYQNPNPDIALVDDSVLHLPPPNLFIPTDFSIKPWNKPEPPKINCVLSTPIARLWHKQDITFNRPKVHMSFELMNPLCYSSPTNSIMTRLWTYLLEDSLSEFAYDASLIGTEYALNNTIAGCQLSVKRYNDRILLLINGVFQKMADYEIPSEEVFLIQKERLSKEYKNTLKQEQYLRTIYLSSLITESSRWHVDGYIPIINNVTFEMMRNFIKQIHQQLYLEGLIQGNMTEEEACDIVNKLVDRLKPAPLMFSQIPQRRIVKIPKGISVYNSVSSNLDVNSVIENYYQVGLENARENFLLDLFAQYFQDHAYHQLRTVQQLGYIVFSIPKRHYGVQGFRVIIQSANYDPKYLDSRIEELLSNGRKHFDEMPDKSFAEHLAALIAEKLEPDKTLSDETTRNLSEINNGTFVFDKRERESAIAEKLTKNDLLQFFEKFIHPSSPHRRKLSIQVWGKNHPLNPELRARNDGFIRSYQQSSLGENSNSENGQNTESSTEKKVVYILDHSVFQRSCYICPLPTPHKF